MRCQAAVRGLMRPGTGAHPARLSRAAHSVRPSRTESLGGDDDVDVLGQSESCGNLHGFEHADGHRTTRATS